MEANGIPKHVDLNVGGTHYTTSLSTLTSYPDSLLYKIFSKSTIPLDKDRKGRYVIDRDGKVFRYILNFLRGGHLNLHGNFKEYDQLREEVTYYKLKAMKSLLNDWQTGKNKRINPEQQTDENGTEGRRKDITPEMLDLDPDTVDNDYQSDMELPDECDTPLWFMDTNFRKSPYVPQMGDEVMYFWQGHKCYVEAVKKQCVYDIDGTKFPWDRGDLKTEEPMRVVGLEYHSGPPITCEIKVVSINPVTKKIAGKNFQFRYHVMPEIKDFMILTQHYEISMKRKWKVGDQFRAAIDNKWCLGVIKDKKPTDTEYPESFFQGFVIRWKNGKSDVLSLWDLEPIESKDSFIKVREGTQITNTEMQQLRYNPTTGDWSGSDQNTECDRIRACLDQITSLEVAKILTAPTDHSDDLDDASVVPYPIKVETIRERLKKRFYRRRLALQWEVRQIETNANLFNEPDSEVVKSAELVTNILLEVVRNVKVDNAVDLYNRMAGIIDTEQETEKKGKERSNGVKKVFSSDEESVGKQETERKGKKRSRTVKVSSSDEESESKQKTERKAKNRSRRAKKVSSSDEESDDETKTPPKKRRSTRMHDEKRWVTECENLLVDILFPLEDSKYFRTPNSKSSVFKDYADVIEEPMDLTTVKERMSRGDYENPHEFAKDIRLIVSNSKAYFTDKKSKIYSMTREFSKVFEDNIRDILMNYKNAAAYKKLPRGNGTPSSIKKGKDRKQDSWEKLTPPDKPGPSGIQKKPKTLQACSYTSTLKAKEDEDDSDRETVCSAPTLSDDEWQQSVFDNLSGTDEDDITAKTRDRTSTTKSPKIKLRPLKVKERDKAEEMQKQTKHRKSSSSSDDSIFEVDLLHDSS